MTSQVKPQSLLAESNNQPPAERADLAGNRLHPAQKYLWELCRSLRKPEVSPPKLEIVEPNSHLNDFQLLSE
jgi:hypothetical protein